MPNDIKKKSRNHLEIGIEISINEYGETRVVHLWKMQSTFHQKIYDDEEYYYLHHELIVQLECNDDLSAITCSNCLSSIQNNNTSQRSIASGVDFGSGAQIGLENLSFQEFNIISLARHHYNVIKIESNRRLQEHSQSAIKGSSILFDQDAPFVVVDLLTTASMHSNVCLHFLGYEGDFDSLFKKNYG